MAEVKHQQRLFLEWLNMAGNIAVSDVDNGSLLYATQYECQEAGWVKLSQFGSGFFMAALTDQGREVVKDRRSSLNDSVSTERRRART
ncbi:MAG: hypothetical protein JKY92_09690 [Magnetovibrio sp.]|nr:hypothetical protein [Magnetovibrio sp.]